MAVASIRRGVVLGSYVTYFDQLWPHVALVQQCLWIRSRVEQARQRLAGREKRVSTVPAAATRGGLMRTALPPAARPGGRAGSRGIRALQTATTLFDPAPSRAELGNGAGRLDQALRATVRACLPGRWQA